MATTRPVTALSYRNVYIAPKVDKILWGITLLFLFIPSEKISILGLTVIGFIRLGLSLSKNIISFPKIVMYAAFLFVLSAISYMVYVITSGLFFSYTSYIFTGGYFFLFIMTSFYTYPNIYRKVIRLFVVVTTIESVLGIIQARAYDFAPGDWTTGSLPHAHILGFYTAYSILFAFLFFSRKTTLFLVVFLLTAHYLSNTLQFSASILVGILIYFLFYSNFFVLLRLMMVSVMVVLVLPFFIYLSQFFFQEGPTLASLQYVPKVQGYMTIPRVFGDYPHVLLLGTSPGTYSSRAAVSLASPRILSKDSKENPIVENSPYLVKYLAPYYSPEFYATLGNTGTFYTPFSSVLGIIIEYGLIGCLLFILLFRNIIKLNKKILKVHNIGAVNIILTFALIMVFFYDTWFEHSMIMLPYLISLGYAFSLNKIPAKTENRNFSISPGKTPLPCQ
jgi:hypothetical protein